MDSIVAFFGSAVTPPNKIKLTIMGPRVVPNEFMPPAKLRRCEPVSGFPRAITKGCAEVCCNENPNATINNAPKIKGNEPIFTAGIMANAPATEINKPNTIPFL